MQIDRHGLEVLPRAECLHLLSTVNSGRVGLSMNALPVIFTINFALDGDAVVFRTRPSTKLTAAIAGNVVCFHADSVDRAGHFGWSVNLTGQALLVDDLAPRLELLALPNWFPDSHWIRVS